MAVSPKEPDVIKGWARFESGYLITALTMEGETNIANWESPDDTAIYARQTCRLTLPSPKPQPTNREPPALAGGSPLKGQTMPPPIPEWSGEFIQWGLNLTAARYTLVLAAWGTWKLFSTRKKG